ncbi:MAG: type I methionyl aminopeptidase, partial [Erysipelotrichaceae bacterium]|nr:type I methionyl aminopeptidase [Erysipelotrichaceae bacterium]
ADLGYMGYPKSICTSVNDVICHGIPSDDVILKEGDIINVDATTQFRGFFADASRMFCIGHVSDEAKELVDVTKECLQACVDQLKPWENTLGDAGKIISRIAHLHGFSVVEEYCGHGVGLSMHEDPYILHYESKGPSYTIVPGMVFTIEPMINQGKKGIRISKDGWTASTVDGKLSAQWEHTLLVTETGLEVLSK